jgi:hypothetical protein
MERTMNLSVPIIFSFLFLYCAGLETKNDSIFQKISVKNPEKLSAFNNYWYSGKAEITSYKLTQARYGEIHKGSAVNIFVTEDFLAQKQVKADAQKKTNISILKLNTSKKFNTGIYPYSLMTSTFSPIDIAKKALKISFSAQEWCGNTFVQLNNKDNFQIDFHSYFETNSDKTIILKKAILENEVWNQIRISPKKLPLGKLQIIPSFEYLALNHKKIQAYEAVASLQEKENFISYTITYPTLERTLSIKTSKEFPYYIESWEETSISRGKTLTTKAIKIKTILSAYWRKNGVADVEERNQLSG